MRKSNCDKQNGMPGIVFTCKETKLRFDGCNKNGVFHGLCKDAAVGKERSYRKSRIN